MQAAIRSGWLMMCCKVKIKLLESGTTLMIAPWGIIEGQLACS
jgi:hypothetical protein